jgi:hypothetical protein
VTRQLKVNVVMGTEYDGSGNGLKIYPNPVIDILTIDSPSRVKGIAITDALGKLQSEVSYSSGVADLSKLSFGIYFLQVDTNHGRHMVRVIKQ